MASCSEPASGCSDSELTDLPNSRRESPRSLLDVLKCPDPSTLARKRAIKSKPPVGVKKSKGRAQVSDPKGVLPSDRLKEFPNECLKINFSKKLFCEACREVVSHKKSSVQTHLKSNKHKKGKDRLQRKVASEMDIAKALKLYDQQNHPVGETLPDSVRVYRIRVLTAMLKSGTAISKIDHFRELLEENALALTSTPNMRQLLPFVLGRESDRVKAAIRGRPISIIFDGTTHVCEALVIVVRYLTDEWVIKQDVCRLMLLAKSMTGEEVARQIISCISTEMGISSDLVIGAMHDRASVNQVAMRTAKVIYQNILDIGCFSHTLDRVGENMKTPILDEFSKAWIGMFTRSPKTRERWKSLTGLPPPSYSVTRWWSRYEVLAKLMVTFGDATTLLEDEDISPANAAKLRAILDDPAKKRKLKIELAATVDCMEPFVKATYNLEGDGFLALETYESVNALYIAILSKHWPNVAAMTKKEANGNSIHEKQLLDYADTCLKPAYEYFKLKFDQDLKPAMNAFKAARLFSPSKVNSMHPTPSDINDLSVFPFFPSSVIEELKKELPNYLSVAEDVSSAIDPVAWWRDHEYRLPNWARACKYITLIQPSSAAAERVFSLLSNSFKDNQERALEDYVSASVMLQYNSR